VRGAAARAARGAWNGRCEPRAHGQGTSQAGGFQLSARAIEDAIRRVEGPGAVLDRVEPLAADRAATELKHVGYGEPLLVRYRVGDEARRLVLRTMSPNWFGHDRRADRASLAILAADTYDLVPRHVRVLDVGAVADDGRLTTIGRTGEFYLLTTYVEGQLYAHDLRRVEEQRRAASLDVARAAELARYLVALHTEPFAGPPELYARAIRDLVGSGEGIFGIVDWYPRGGPVSERRLAAIERRCIDWRFRLRDRAGRLRRTHGDFHPYNLLFREGLDFSVLDASRGCVGDPADDVAALAVNYLFGAIVYPGAWAEGLSPLWDGFWSTYLEGAGREVLEVVAPFFAWRALVVASPVWYPDVSPEGRDRLLAFAEAALDADAFDPASAARFAP
jgi:aminoglycoside phosphotransferase (APT) family kinase protein